jgi:hypothetical protein
MTFITSTLGTPAFFSLTCNNSNELLSELQCIIQLLVYNWENENSLLDSYGLTGRSLLQQYSSNHY